MLHPAQLSESDRGGTGQPPRSGLREKLFEWALRLARRLSYRGAGTVEFIVDADSRSVLPEMNKRLQVEHPNDRAGHGIEPGGVATAVAQGERLLSARRSRDPRHAIESPDQRRGSRQQLPAGIGVCQLYREPLAEGYALTAVCAGFAHHPFYDSLLAKLIAHGETRGLATQRLLQGLKVSPSAA